MDKKFGIALVALIGIGIFALPSTIALFSGQHSFYNIDATGNQVPCVKCHGDVKAELNSNDLSGSVAGSSPGPHKNFQCEYCHRTEAGFSSGDDAYAKIWYTKVTTGEEIALVTTIENFEVGNFPKRIDFVVPDTIDTLLGTADAQNWDSSQFSEQPIFQVTDPADGVKKYAGILGYTTVNATSVATAGLYNFSFSEEKSTAGAQVTKAFNPRELTETDIGSTSDSLGATGMREVTPGTRYHAASLVSCMECHGGEQSKGFSGYTINTTKPYNHGEWVLEDPQACANCHYGGGDYGEYWFSAGGFGLTNVRNDTGSVEAHKQFVKADAGGVLRSGSDPDTGGYGAANIACVACHTHVAVDINFQKKYKVEFDAIAGDEKGIWTVDNFKANGTVNITVFGNTEGNVFATSNKSYNWTPPAGTTLYINGSGTPISGLQGETNDSEAALIS